MDRERCGCIGGGASGGDCSRRGFLAGACGAVMGAPILSEVLSAAESCGAGGIAPAGPASKYTPSVRAAFVRRKGEYGMRWPGQIYDGKAALAKYRDQMEQAGKRMGLKLDLRPAPIYSLAEADEWIVQAKSSKPDGLFIVLLDRQEHAWPTATKAVDSQIPTVIFAPLGAAFTTNTAPLSKRTGVFISSTDDFGQAIHGMKMLHAHAKLREMRYVVLKGNQRKDSQVRHLGTRLRYVPAKTFLEEYQRTEQTGEIERIAEEYLKHATRVSGPTKQDLLNGVKSYVVARSIMQREEGDGITMDCLGALGRSKVSLPCISWSRMLDAGIPAACEADINAATTHALVQYLFDRPGFQQDPVGDTAKECLTGSHCTCPTRLNGFDQPGEPYYLSHHHGMRDATPRPTWRVGQRVTVAQFVLSNKDEAPPQMIISAGEVIENPSVPPSGGCVVAVSVKLDGVSDYLAYPGFHQVFFYGDYKRQLVSYCKLFGVQARVV
ncbi:MAG: hypothetical protein JXQ73_01280 [Phycisphaerae bacterium]|nr:hypothetical protein [Phycisphaerae bacterium]